MEFSGEEKFFFVKMVNCKMFFFCILKFFCIFCLDCGGFLCYCNILSKVILFIYNDIKLGLKIFLKCNLCNIFYGYARYGDSKKGYKFYVKLR